MRICSVDGCEKKHFGKGLCRKHYSRLSRTGKLEKKTLKEKFINNFIPVTETGCWLWEGYGTVDGYGQIMHNNKTRIAHRISWELHNGAIPDGLLVLHKCDTRCCVNPSHLFIGTAQDNSDDMVRKNRSNRAYGENNSNSALTWNDVNNIRKLSSDGMSQRKIAKKFVVSQFCIHSVCTYKRWNNK